MIVNKNNQKIIAKNVTYAANFWQRLTGLMGRKAIKQDSALFIYPCQQIHTFFMRFSIDCAFIDDNYQVIKLYESLKPWRMSQKVSKAYGVIELPAGTIKNALIKEQDTLCFIRRQQNEV